jgi:hypothetical protein
MGKWRPAGSALGGVLAPRNRAEGLKQTIANCCTIGELSTTDAVTTPRMFADDAASVARTAARIPLMRRTYAIRNRS